MKLINSMQTLKDDIRSGRQKRRQDIKTIKQDTKQLAQDTHKMVADSERNRREEASNEKRKLNAFTKDLEQDVVVLRKGFRQDQAEVRKEISTASSIWHGKASAIEKPEAKENEGEE